jgi:hypothetical protein
MTVSKAVLLVLILVRLLESFKLLAYSLAKYI